MSEFNENNFGGDVVTGVDTVKKGKGGKIAAGVAAGVVVLGAAGGAVAYSCSDLVKNQVKLAFSKPEAYYSWVTEKNASDFSQKVSTVYREALDESNKSFSTSFSVKYEISDVARTMVKSQLLGADDTYGEIIDNLKSFTLGADAQVKDKLSSGALYAELNDDRLATMELSADASTLDMFFRIPELTERWLGVEGSLVAVANDESANELLETYRKALEDPEKVLSPDEVKTEIDRYIGVWNSTFDDVKLEKKEDVTIGDITVKYTVASVDIDEAKAKVLAENMINSAKEDEILKAVLIDRTKSMTADEYDKMMKEALDSILEDVTDPNGNTITLKTFIDPKGGIRGIDIVQNEEEGNEIYAVIGKDGDAIRGEAYFMDGGNKDLSMTMSAIEEKKKSSGSVELIADGTKISVEFKDYEVVDEKKGYFNGTYTLNVPMIDPISIACTTDGKSQQFSSQIVVSGIDFGKVTLEFASNEGGSPAAVDKSSALMVSQEEIEDFELSDYIEEDKMASFISGILEKVGLDKSLSDMLADYAAESMYDSGSSFGSVYDPSSDSSFGSSSSSHSSGFDRYEDFDWDIMDDDLVPDFGINGDELFDKAYNEVHGKLDGVTLPEGFGSGLNGNGGVSLPEGFGSDFNGNGLDIDFGSIGSSDLFN